jgi:hypothetical protein
MSALLELVDKTEMITGRLVGVRVLRGGFISEKERDPTIPPSV